MLEVVPKLRDEAPKAGILERLVKRIFLRSAEIAAIEDVGEHYRLIAISGDALKDLAWVPGQQIQIGVGPGMVNRAYTPIDWNAATGRVRFLVFLHSNAPGCEWTRAAQRGQRCEMLGPKRSLELTRDDRAPVLFGDETCIGLAAAYRSTDGGAAARFIFEVGDVAQARLVSAGFGLDDAMLIERRPSDCHLSEAAQAVLAASEHHHRIVLAGKAASIQAVKTTLKAALVDQRRVKTKAYWAPGKVGLN